MESNRKKIVICSIIFFLILTIIGITYAFMGVQLTSTKKFVITAGALDLILDEEENNLMIENALPMYDEVGMIQDAFTFRLINNSEKSIDYQIQIVDITIGDKLATDIVKYGLTKDGTTQIKKISELTNGIIDSGTIEKNTIEYALRLWIDLSIKDNDLISGKSLSYRIDVVAKETQTSKTTYIVDNNIKYQEDVQLGGTVLTPTTFTPEKEGWDFIGWRDDKTASGDVLTTKIVEGGEITLYAVYSQPVTISYNGNGATSGSTASETKERYYNAAGNIENPTFTLATNGFTKTSYSFSKWAQESASGTQYAAGTSITLAESTSFYAIWTFTTIRAYTFNKTSNYCENVSNVYNDAFIRFENSGYVGSYISIDYDSNGRGIRLIPSRSGTLRFYLKAYNQTGANLTSNCTIYIDNVKYQNTIGANSSKVITQELTVTSGQIINIGNDGQNGYMYITSGSYIDWIS